MRLQTNIQLPVEPEQLVAQLTYLLRDIGNQVNSLTEGAVFANHAARIAAPTTGTFAQGDFIQNSTPSSGFPIYGWLNVASGSPGTFIPLATALPYIHLRDQKNNDVGGGTSTTNTVHTRVLNTEATDTHSLCTLASNQFTLTAGTYQVKASAPACASDSHRVHIYNATDTAVVLLGTSEWAGSATELVQTRSFVNGRFTIAAGKALELRHFIETGRATNGLGVHTTPEALGSEVYAEVELWRVA